MFAIKVVTDTGKCFIQFVTMQGDYNICGIANAKKWAKKDGADNARQRIIDMHGGIVTGQALKVVEIN